MKAEAWSSLVFSDDARLLYNKRRAANESGYCDAEMDGLLNQAERELSPERRKALFERVVAKQLEDVPELYIGFVPRFHTLPMRG